MYFKFVSGQLGRLAGAVEATGEGGIALNTKT